MRKKDGKKQEVVMPVPNNGVQMSDEQLAKLADRLAEKEVEARERLQVMRDLFPQDLEAMLMQGRVPANLVMDVTDLIVWWKSGEPDTDLVEVLLTTLMRLLIGKDGNARYETLAAYEAQKEKRDLEEEGGL